MAYIGKSPSIGSFQKLDSIAGLQNGVTTAFQMKVSGQPYSPDTASQLLVVRDSTVLEPGTDYSINGTYITILPAPEEADNIWVLTFGQARYTGVPSDGTVTNDTIADSTIEYDKFSGDAVATIIGNIITFGI
jgi:hypothetical protein